MVTRGYSPEYLSQEAICKISKDKWPQAWSLGRGSEIAAKENYILLHRHATEKQLPFWEVCFWNLSNFGVTWSKIRVKWSPSALFSSGLGVGTRPLTGLLGLEQGSSWAEKSSANRIFLRASSQLRPQWGETRAHSLINQPRGIIHTEKSSNQVARMCLSLSTITNCLEMSLQFWELALGFCSPLCE